MIVAYSFYHLVRIVGALPSQIEEEVCHLDARVWPQRVGKLAVACCYLDRNSDVLARWCGYCEGQHRRQDSQNFPFHGCSAGSWELCCEKFENSKSQKSSTSVNSYIHPEVFWFQLMPPRIVCCCILRGFECFGPPSQSVLGPQSERHEHRLLRDSKFPQSFMTHADRPSDLALFIWHTSKPECHWTDHSD